MERLNSNILISRLQFFFTALLFFLPIWYAFERRFGSPEALATMYAATYLISIVLELPTGALADLIGRKNVVCAGFLIQGASYIFLSQAQNMSWLWTGYAINQVGGTLVSGANTALLYDTLKELKKESQFTNIMSKNEIVYRIGITLAAAMGGYLFTINMQLPYILVGIATIIAGIVTFFSVEPTIDSEKFTLKNYLLQTQLGFAQLWKTSYIRDFSIYYVSIGGISWYYLFFLYNARMTDAGFSAVERGWIGAANSILVGLVAIFIARRVVHNRTVVYLYFPIIMLIGFFLTPYLSGWFATISIFLIYCVGITRYIFLDQYANQEFESKYRATAISALSMIISLIYLLLSLGLNPILTKWGSSGVMFALGVITLFTIVPSMIVLLRSKSH
jgi:MFS family permease